MNKAQALEEIALRIEKCRKCPLFNSRTKPVPGEGNPNAKIVLIGEAPGEKEDLSGRPFVGAAGKVLEDLLKKIGLSRDDVFITNVVKCRPPNNRDPKKDEILACSEYLDEQLKVIQPEIIVILGRHSSHYILKKLKIEVKSIMQLRGKIFEGDFGWGKVLILPTLHPAAALYNPRWRKYLEEDFEKLGEIIRGEKRPMKMRTLESFLGHT